MKDIEGKLPLCRKCRRVKIPEWLLNDLDRAIDLDLPYETVRYSLETIVRRDLCPDCAVTVLRAYTAANT